MEDLTVLVIGAGAREHVISEAYENSNLVKRIIVAPGNSFTAIGRKKEVVVDGNCNLRDPHSILKLAEKYIPDTDSPHLIDVAQDDALALGAVDTLQKYGFNSFGPGRNGAKLESDKSFSKRFMFRNGIPTSPFGIFTGVGGVRSKIYIERLFREDSGKVVYVKASGLCGGKGALKAAGREETKKRIKQMKDFGKAGRTFLIEEALEGEEFSYFAISDGKNYRAFKSAQDYKRVLDKNKGEQTGGMGAVSPAKVTERIDAEIREKLVERAVNGNPYPGIIYVGGIDKDRKKNPFCIEYNVRWGDPEAQVVLPGIQTDYAELVQTAIDGRLNEIDLIQDDLTRVCVVGAAKGYPENSSQAKGKEIFGLREAMKLPGIKVYGAGINVQDGRFYVGENPGRLFSIVGKGNLKEATDMAYDAMEMISIEGDNLHFRKDVGAGRS